MTRFFHLIPCCALLLLAGCGNPFPNFYTLAADGPSPTRDGTRIGVGPVILADYIDRENLVVQTSPNMIEVAEYHLWAGDLDNSIARVVSVNLGRRLDTGNIRTYPWLRDSEIDYQVAMDIREFIAGADGYAHIEATWRVYSLPARKLVKSGTFTAKEPIVSEEFEAMVVAQSKLIGRLSAEIATGIRKR